MPCRGLNHVLPKDVPKPVASFSGSDLGGRTQLRRALTGGAGPGRNCHENGCDPPRSGPEPGPRPGCCLQRGPSPAHALPRASPSDSSAFRPSSLWYPVTAASTNGHNPKERASLCSFQARLSPGCSNPPPDARRTGQVGTPVDAGAPAPIPSPKTELHGHTSASSDRLVLPPAGDTPGSTTALQPPHFQIRRLCGPAQRTPPNILCWSIREKKLKENGPMYMYN